MSTSSSGNRGELIDKVVKEGITPRELATRMTERADAGAALVGELVELYYAAEWGGRRDPAAAQRAIAIALA